MATGSERIKIPPVRDFMEMIETTDTLPRRRKRELSATLGGKGIG